MSNLYKDNQMNQQAAMEAAWNRNAPNGVADNQPSTMTEELTQTAAALSQRLQMLNAMIEQKFKAFYLSEPCLKGNGSRPEETCRSYPPALDLLRNELEHIGRTIEQIADNIERVQL